MFSLNLTAMGNALGKELTRFSPESPERALHNFMKSCNMCRPFRAKIPLYHYPGRCPGLVVFHGFHDIHNIHSIFGRK